MRISDWSSDVCPSYLRHDRFFQVHYVKSGAVRVYLDDQQYVESGPMFFLTPPTIPHSFVTEADSDGHVLTVRQQLVWQLIDADPSLAPAKSEEHTSNSSH